MLLFDNRVYKYVLEEKWKRKAHAALITSTASTAQMGEERAVAYCNWAQHVPWMLEHAHRGAVMACGKVEALKGGQRFAQPPDEPIWPFSVFKHSMRADYGLWESSNVSWRRYRSSAFAELLPCKLSLNLWKVTMVRISEDISLCIKNTGTVRKILISLCPVNKQTIRVTLQPWYSQTPHLSTTPKSNIWTK